MTYALSTFANNGSQCEPQLLKNTPPVCHKIPVSADNIALIKEGMKQACSPGGTGWPLFDFRVRNMALRAKTLAGADKTKQASLEAAMNRDLAYFIPIQTGCKTGTAEAQSKDVSPHAWFVSFAPFDKPEIMVTVLLENAGQGSDIAGPVAKDIFTAYFEGKE
jgi:penicillin-binding protein 2